jgi:hypothetical protein
MNATASRLDPPVALPFKNAAHPGEGSVSGAFWSSLVQIVEAAEAEPARSIDVPADRLTERLEASNPAMAGAAAEREIDLVVSLAGHPSGMLAAVTRMSEGRSIGESFRALPRAAKPTNACTFSQASSEDEQRAEEVDPTSLTRRVAR